MGFKCGIVGLPNVGKSTLFNALTQTAAAEAANYPFCTIEPNVGEVGVPDPRLEQAAAIAKSGQIIPTRLTFVDIAGLVRGASKGEGLGNQFLGNIRECDAIAYVLRCFADDNVVHVEGRVDPLSDAETVETELMLADLESLEKRRSALEKRAKGPDKEAKAMLPVVDKALAVLSEGKPARMAKIDPEEARIFAQLQLLTSKPALYVCNVDEASAATGNAYSPWSPSGRGRKARRRSSFRPRSRRNLPISTRRARRLSGGTRSGGTRPQPADPRRLWPARADHLFHRRPEGSARLDHRRRARWRRPPPASSTPTSRRASSAPKPSPTTISSRLAARRARKRPARCGLRAGNTPCRTATSCISASPTERRLFPVHPA